MPKVQTVLFILPTENGSDCYSTDCRMYVSLVTAEVVLIVFIYN